MVLPAILASKALMKIIPIAFVVGAVYFLIIRPVEKAAAAPAKAIEDAVEGIAQGVEDASETITDVVDSVTKPESFTRPPGTGGSFQEGLFGFGASIQRALTGGLTWREQAVLDQEKNVEALSSLIWDIDLVAPRPVADSGQVNETRALNIQNTFSDQGIANRLTSTIRNTIDGNYSSGFGGYGSAVNQEAELRREIEESKAKYGEWFK